MTQPQPAVKPHWDVRVQAILKSVRRRGTILMVLGYVVYGGGSTLLLTFVADKALATVLVMFFFQLLVLYFGTREMYPAIQGAFRTALEANRDSVPLFESLASSVNRLDSDPANHPLVKDLGDRADRIIREKLMPVVDTWARIGERLEKTTIPQFEKMIAQCADTERKLDSKVSAAVEDARRVTRHVEGELATGILTEIRQAADAVKMLGMQHAPPPMPAAGPRVGQPVRSAPGPRDFSTILSSLSKKNGDAVPAASQGGRA